MVGRRCLMLLLVMSGCAEIEFGVPAGGEQAGGGEPLGGGGGNAPSGEQCLNGIDDDADGEVDCADADCADLGCQEIPPGWLGPVELRDDDSPCDGDFPVGIASLKNAVEAAPATCTCSCVGIPQTCDSAELTLYTSAFCGNTLSTVPLQSGECESLNDATGTDAVMVDPAVVAGSCTASVETSIEPPTFEARRLCGLPAPAGGCDAGTCTPAATCIYMPGNVVCPTGFGMPFMGNAGIIDSRDCDPGSCGCTASGSACSFVLELYDNQNCQGDLVASTANDNCTPVAFGGGGANRGALYTATPGTVECSSSGSGDPVGGVSLNEPITVCCAF